MGQAKPTDRSPDTLSEARRRGASGDEFVHSLLSFSRLDIPEAEVYESVVTFSADTDPLSAHERLAAVFGNKAGSGYFLFRADSSLPGRYWVRSVEPWAGWPDGAVSVLEPTRKVIQLAGGLMYHFTLQVCAGRERIVDGQKHIDPFTTAAEFEAWFDACGPACGFKLLMHSAAPSVLRFRHGTQGYKVLLGTIEGALEIVEPAPMRKALLHGFGSHRRLGLGMLTLSN